MFLMVADPGGGVIANNANRVLLGGLGACAPRFCNLRHPGGLLGEGGGLDPPRGGGGSRGCTSPSQRK